MTQQPAPAVPVDLLIRGGTVIDPETGSAGIADVAVARGRIAGVGKLPPISAATKIDATGQLVTPGLVDLHSHVNWRTSPTAVNADLLAPESGVTTWIDAGSAFATTVESLRENVIERSGLRVLSMLRLGFGRAMRAECDPELLAFVARRHRDVVVAIKLSLGQCELEPLRLALAAAEQSELPLMVHIAQAPPDVSEVLALLRPGDIITHALTGQTMRLFDEQGAPLDACLDARDRGVLFDVGHGAGSFAWASAEAAAALGFFPDTISTDAWQVSVRGPMFDLPTCLSKLLHVGMPLVDVIRAATSRPAELIGRPGKFGTLRVGAPADITILALRDGAFPLYDTGGEVRIARQLLYATRAFVGGRELRRTQSAPGPLADWLEFALSTPGFDPNPQGGVRPEARALQEQLANRGHTPRAFIAELDRAGAAAPA